MGTFLSSPPASCNTGSMSTGHRPPQRGDFAIAFALEMGRVLASPTPLRGVRGGALSAAYYLLGEMCTIPNIGL
ncbi:MAG: hypothetical protein IIA88_11505 [Bacteroidetes bacterium]|nr:hypothetical protein [Bacteroidota bacterium]